MSMSSIKTIKDKLRPLGIYSLTDESQVGKELNTYASELDKLLELLAEEERESFIITAQSYGLENWEKIFGENRDSMNFEKRRELILSRLAIGESNFTRAGTLETLNSLDVDSELYEYPEKNYMHIMCKGVYLPEQKAKIKENVDILLPAHLDIFVDFRNFDYGYIDGLNYTFFTMDRKNYTWEQIENLIV